MCCQPLRNMYTLLVNSIIHENGKQLTYNVIALIQKAVQTQTYTIFHSFALSQYQQRAINTWFQHSANGTFKYAIWSAKRGQSRLKYFKFNPRAPIGWEIPHLIITQPLNEIVFCFLWLDTKKSGVKIASFTCANRCEVVLKSNIIYRPHPSNSTKGVVVSNVHTIFFGAIFTAEECHLSKRLLILILSFFLLCAGVGVHLFSSYWSCFLFPLYGDYCIIDEAIKGHRYRMIAVHVNYFNGV